MNDLDHMKQLIQLVESANLAEAPIDDFSTSDKAYPNDDNWDDLNLAQQGAEALGGTAILLSPVVPFFMDVTLMQGIGVAMGVIHFVRNRTISVVMTRRPCSTQCPSWDYFKS